MLVDRHDRANIFELAPGLRVEMDPELRELDRLLSDDALLAAVKAGASKRRAPGHPRAALHPVGAGARRHHADPVGGARRRRCPGAAQRPAAGERQPYTRPGPRQEPGAP
jgi:hypothetical protein